MTRRVPLPVDMTRAIPWSELAAVQTAYPEVGGRGS